MTLYIALHGNETLDVSPTDWAMAAGTAARAAKLAGLPSVPTIRWVTRSTDRDLCRRVHEPIDRAGLTNDVRGWVFGDVDYNRGRGTYWTSEPAIYLVRGRADAPTVAHEVWHLVCRFRGYRDDAATEQADADAFAARLLPVHPRIQERRYAPPPPIRPVKRAPDLGRRAALRSLRDDAATLLAEGRYGESERASLRRTIADMDRRLAAAA